MLRHEVFHRIPFSYDISNCHSNTLLGMARFLHLMPIDHESGFTNLLFCKPCFFYNDHRMIFLLWLVFITSNCSIELDTLRQVVQTTFARNSSDLSFELGDWVAHLTPITSSLSLLSNEIYRSFIYFDANVDGTVTFQELIDKMGYVPTLRVGPKQLHIGFTGTDNEMQVMWVTQPEKAIKPVVRYGQDPLHLNEQASAVWNEYN